jgi:hypothetical protein
MLRSCYSTRMRFYPDRPDVLTRVQWFFVSPTTPFLEADNVFTSRNWADAADFWPDLGEVQGYKRPWRNGSPPAVAPQVDSCGSVHAFAEGVPFAERGTRLYRSDGQLVCCAGPEPEPVPAAGGVLGGDSWEGVGDAGIVVGGAGWQGI